MLSSTLSVRCARRFLVGVVGASLWACTTEELPTSRLLDAGEDSSAVDADDSGAPGVNVEGSASDTGSVSLDASDVVRLDSRSDVRAPLAQCEIGVPDFTGLAFADIGADRLFPISGGGQSFMSMMLGLRVTGLGDDLMVYVKSFVTGQEPEDAGMSEPSARDAAADSSLTDAADPEAGTDSGGDAIVDASLDAVGPVFGAADTDWHARPVDADCGDDGVCRWVPLIVPLLGGAPESELECLPVTLRVNVDNGAMYCTTTVSGVLTRELTANSCTD